MLDMVKVLEGEEHNIKLFVPGRDDLAGTEKFVLTADMIANRYANILYLFASVLNLNPLMHTQISPAMYFNFIFVAKRVRVFCLTTPL